jgi:hypothetical protein
MWSLLALMLRLSGLHDVSFAAVLAFTAVYGAAVAACATPLAIREALSAPVNGVCGARQEPIN